MDEAQLTEIAEAFHSLWPVPPVGRSEYDIGQLREFLDFTARFAIDNGVSDVDELAEIISHAASIYVAKGVEYRIGHTLNLSFEGASPAINRGAAFFRRFATR